MKYSDQFVDWLVEEGYTHCFFVAGGNIMHLLNSVRSKMTCVPFVNEVAAAIAAEYFTVATEDRKRKAFVLVTAGPGFTNTVTAIASAWTESRELLVVGGQVKSSDLADGLVRQRGIQEINGVDLARPITKGVLQIKEPLVRSKVVELINIGRTGRKGPVFIEFTLDAQAGESLPAERSSPVQSVELPGPSNMDIEKIAELVNEAERPVLLLGSGLSRKNTRALANQLLELSIPIMLTWNGADLFPAEFPLNMGRPNTWGQRSSNVLIQQADLLIAIGTRLGVQQTGFAWDEFVPNGSIVQIDIDQSELDKPHPKKRIRFNSDGDAFLNKFVANLTPKGEWQVWLEYNKKVRSLLPLSEESNVTSNGFVNPFQLMAEVANVTKEKDLIIPCSSGGAFTVTMQGFELKGDQKMISNKGMASMGYGLSGAIGGSLALPKNSTYLFEGDGGFAQNLQELGTVKANNLNLKMFIFSNHGYASIRMTQRNYFDGAWIGCDEDTGLGLPNWEQLSKAYGIEFIELSPEIEVRQRQLEFISEFPGPLFIRVPIDPEQTYYPKIASRVLENGQMKSNPLHLMEPPLEDKLSAEVLRYI